MHNKSHHNSLELKVELSNQHIACKSNMDSLKALELDAARIDPSIDIKNWNLLFWTKQYDKRQRMRRE